MTGDPFVLTGGIAEGRERGHGAFAAGAGILDEHVGVAVRACHRAEQCIDAPPADQPRRHPGSRQRVEHFERVAGIHRVHALAETDEPAVLGDAP